MADRVGHAPTSFRVTAESITVMLPVNKISSHLSKFRYNNLMIKHKIRSLRNEGKKYREIAETLNCALSTVAYHCSDKTKKKQIREAKAYKARNPLIKKLDSFNQAYKKKGIYNKLHHFSRRGFKTSDITLQGLLDSLGNQTTTQCYLTGDIIDISEPSTYSFDHRIPVAKGGDNSFANLGICTQDANMAKSDMTPEEFVTFCKKVLVHNGYLVEKLAPALGNAPS